MRKGMKQLKSNKGITLVALIVTIIVLVILASISIGALSDKKGIIEQVKDAKKKNNGILNGQQGELNELLLGYKNAMDGVANTNQTEIDNELEPPIPTPIPTPTPTPEVPTGPNGNQLVSSVTDTNHDTIEGEDNVGNKVVIPGGFKIAEDSGNTIQEGIVIEDDIGNQFVWIPVSNINGDGSNKIKRDDGSEVEIILGRYTFDTSTGVEKKVQYASEYETAKYINTYYAEYSKRTGAQDLKGFIGSVQNRGGYFLARYEASYASGTQLGLGDNENYYRVASKVTSKYYTGSMVYTEGSLWNFITGNDAKILGRQMYYGNDYVKSDLVNSYMWDTAIIYIQKMGHENYANLNWLSVLMNTGKTKDERCKIFDMAGNLEEWSTEVETNESRSVCRGARLGTSITASRGTYGGGGNRYVGLRVGLYLK